MRDYPTMYLAHSDGRRYVIRRAEPPMNYWAGVGVEVVIGGEVRRHAVEFDVREVGPLSDDRLLAMGKPHLEEWIEAENASAR